MSPAVSEFTTSICSDVFVGACAIWVVKYFAVTPAWHIVNAKQIILVFSPLAPDLIQTVIKCVKALMIVFGTLMVIDKC